MLSKPGSKAYMAEYLRLTKHRESLSRPASVGALINDYTKSEWFTSKSTATRRDYERYLAMIRLEFGNMPLVALEARGARKIIIDWLEGMRATPRAADLAKSVFARVLAFGVDREDLMRHPLKAVKRMSKGSRKENVWPVETIKNLLANGKPHLVDVAIVALWSMQRQGDCLAMTPMAYDGERVRIRQSKTGAYVWIAPTNDFKAILDRAKAGKQLRVLMNSQGDKWTSSGFRSSWRAEMKRLGITGLTFHDFRGSAITYAYASLIQTQSQDDTIQRIAEISGHSYAEAESIIRRYYLAGDDVVRAIQKSIA